MPTARATKLALYPPVHLWHDRKSPACNLRARADFVTCDRLDGSMSSWLCVGDCCQTVHAVSAKLSRRATNSGWHGAGGVAPNLASLALTVASSGAFLWACAQSGQLHTSERHSIRRGGRSSTCNWLCRLYSPCVRKHFPMAKQPLKPGQPTPASGQYAVVGPRGGATGEEITSVQGHRLPPTPKPNQGFVLVDPTHNGSGDGKRK